MEIFLLYCLHPIVEKFMVFMIICLFIAYTTVELCKHILLFRLNYASIKLSVEKFLKKILKPHLTIKLEDTLQLQLPTCTTVKLKLL